MLTGRESLQRVIGRRRRPISAAVRHLIISQPPSRCGVATTPQPDGTDHQSCDSSTSGAASSDKVEEELVPCPVCTLPLRPNDYCINTHLDICLQRGTKRKLKQSNLLHFRINQHSRTAPSPGIVDNKEVPIGGAANRDVHHAPVSSSCTGGARENCVQLIIEDKSSSASVICGNHILPMKLEDACCERPGKSILSNSAVGTIKKSTDVATTNDANSTSVLETVIVGRKFHGMVNLQPGLTIVTERDPENQKDRNAIKVLSADSENQHMLGYLPREVAKCLAPILDEYNIECKGVVLSLPEQLKVDVPIQLNCQRTQVDDHKSVDKCFESLWEDLLSAVDNGKMQPQNARRYQNNFKLMLNNVLASSSHLFNENGKSFIDLFSSLSNDGQRLFIRLYTRKGPWFQLSKIFYPEISDTQSACEELKLSGYLYVLSSTDDPPEYDMKEVFSLLNVAEMRELLNKELPKGSSGFTHRHELLAAFSSAHESGKCPKLSKRVRKHVGTCVRVSTFAEEVLWRIQRLFFLNGEQDLSSFLLVDLGIVKFPNYVIDIKHHIFRDNSVLKEYEEAIEVAQMTDDYLENGDLEMVFRCIDISESRLCTTTRTDDDMVDGPPAFFSHFSGSWIYSKILTLGVSVYEREHRYNEASRILKILLSNISNDSRRGYWTLRLSIDLEHMSCVNESLEIAEAGLLDRWVRAGSKMALQKRVLRLGKPPRRWKVPKFANSVNRKIKELHIMGRPLNCETGTKNMFYGYDGELCGVEELALQYYADEGGGWKGVHSESSIWLTMFGLLMWDVVFADIPDVFRSRFQTAPLDLDTEGFYEARKDRVEAQLQKIKEGMAEVILITSWEMYFGTACRGVHWDRYSLTDLRAVVSCISSHSLASLCRHLALDYRSWSSGMPDLLLWRLHGETGGGEAKLVEVKGPNDRLSEQQRAWMLILLDCGFDAEVCKVSTSKAC